MGCGSHWQPGEEQAAILVSAQNLQAPGDALGAWFFSVGSCRVHWCVFAGPLTAYLPGLVLVSLGATLVESLPISGLDNLTVPAAALLLGFALLG